MFISIVTVIKTFNCTCCLCFPVQNWGWFCLVEHCFFRCNFYFCHHCQNLIFPIAGWLLIGYDVVCTAPRSPPFKSSPHWLIIVYLVPIQSRENRRWELDSRVWGRWAPTPPGACLGRRGVRGRPRSLVLWHRRRNCVIRRYSWRSLEAEMAEIQADYTIMTHHSAE